MSFKTYKKTATVEAKLFEEGDESGFSCIPFVAECEWRNPISKMFKDCKFCTEDIKKKPYVSTLENQMHFGDFRKNYLCIGIDGERYLCEKDIFERTYALA